MAKNFKSFSNNGVEISSRSFIKIKFLISLGPYKTPKLLGLDSNTSVQSARRARSFGSLSWTFLNKFYEIGAKGVYSSSRKDSDYSKIRLKIFCTICLDKIIKKS